MNSIPEAIKAGPLDPIASIIPIIRDSIEAGLVPDEPLELFDMKINWLKGKELEDYLQTLWDDL